MEIRAIDLIAAIRAAMPNGEGENFVLESVYGDYLTFREEGDKDDWAVRYDIDKDANVVLSDEPIEISEELRAVLNAKSRDALDDSDFAYVDSKGGRHLPVHDAPHVKSALSRFGQTNFESSAAKKSAAKKVCSAAKKLGVTVADDDPVAMACRTSFEVVRQGRRQRRDLAPSLEHRRFDAAMEIRDVDTKGTLVTLRGTPIVYDTGYKVRDMLGEFNETMHTGVATELLQDPGFDSRFFFDHKGMPMASSLGKTLRFEDTKHGLDVFPTVDTRSPSAMDLYVNVEAGNVRSMSVGFMTNESGEEWDARGENRHIHKLSALPDVSAVSFPASTTTSIMLARSAFAFGSADSRERLRRLYPLAKQVRSGQPLTQADGELLIRAIENLYEADDLDEETLIEAFRSLEAEAPTPKVENTEQRLLIQRQSLALAKARANSIAR